MKYKLTVAAWYFENFIIKMKLKIKEMKNLTTVLVCKQTQKYSFYVGTQFNSFTFLNVWFS